MKIINVIFMVLSGWFLWSCAPEISRLPTETAVAPSATRAISTRTPWPEPTRPALYTPNPQKKVLVEFGYYQVSGGATFDFTLGLNFPRLLLYSDGQLLISQPDSRILEKNMSAGEMCEFLLNLTEAGFYEVQTDNSRRPGDPLYDFPTDTPSSYCGNEYRILVNGPQPKQLRIYGDYKDYLVLPASASLRFLEDFRTDGLRPYNVEQLLLHAEPNPAEYDVPTNGDVLSWPEDLPELAEGAVSTIYLSNARATSMFQYFRDPYDYRIFDFRGSEFVVWARPVLPHETYAEIVDNRGMSAPASYKLPFECR